MGGGYPSRTGENNFEGNAGAASDVAKHWPTKIVYSGYEVGRRVFTGHTVSAVHPSSSPVRAAHRGVRRAPVHEHPSYDLTAAYHAIVPATRTSPRSAPGTNAIDELGVQHVHAGRDGPRVLPDARQRGRASRRRWRRSGTRCPARPPRGSRSPRTPPSPATLGGTYGVASRPGDRQPRDAHDRPELDVGLHDQRGGTDLVLGAIRVLHGRRQRARRHHVRARGGAPDVRGARRSAVHHLHVHAAGESRPSAAPTRRQRRAAARRTL